MKKKLTILALHLGYGGIERCICNLANLLKDDLDIEVVSIYKLDKEPKFKFDKKIKITYLTELKPNKEEFKNALKSFHLWRTFKEGIKALKILYIKHKVVVNYLKNSTSDYYLSTRIYLNEILGQYGNGIKIAWEHNHHHNNEDYMAALEESCYGISKLVLVSNNLQHDYQKMFKEDDISCECIYIPNFIDELPSKNTTFKTKNLISVGRLSKEKGMDDLIRVFKEIHDKDDKTFLNIVGDGPEREKLEKLVDSLNLNSCVNFHGFLDAKDIEKLYLNSSIYLMTSHTESFGLVLIEAMSYSLPCISFDSAEGARDIIKQGENGYLVKNRNLNDFAVTSLKLLDDNKELKKLGKNAKKTAKEYLGSNVKEKWLELFK